MTGIRGFAFGQSPIFGLRMIRKTERFPGRRVSKEPVDNMADHDKAPVPQEQSDTIIEACVADIRALLDMRMDAYFKEVQGLDDLSEGLGRPVAVVRDL